MQRNSVRGPAFATGGDEVVRRGGSRRAGDQLAGILGEPAGDGCRLGSNVVTGADGYAAVGTTRFRSQGFW